MTAETSTQKSPWPFAEDTLAALAFSRYLWDGSPVRAASEAETAEYARRLTSPEWQRLYCHAPGYVAPVIAEGLPPAPAETVVPDENAGAGGGELGGSVLTVTTVKTTAAAGIAAVEDATADPDAPSERDKQIVRPGALALVVAAAADESAGLVLGGDGRDDTSAAAEGDAAAIDLPWPGAKPTSPEVAGTAEARPGQLDLPGRPTVSAAEGAKPVNALPGELDQTAVIEVHADPTQAISAVTDSTEGGEQA